MTLSVRDGLSTGKTRLFRAGPYLVSNVTLAYFTARSLVMIK